METREQIIDRIEDAKNRMQQAVVTHVPDSEEFKAAYDDQIRALGVLGTMDRAETTPP